MATHNGQIVNTLRHRVIAENGRVVRDEAEGEYNTMIRRFSDT